MMNYTQTIKLQKETVNFEDEWEYKKTNLKIESNQIKQIAIRRE